MLQLKKKLILLKQSELNTRCRWTLSNIVLTSYSWFAFSEFVARFKPFQSSRLAASQSSTKSPWEKSFFSACRYAMLLPFFCSHQCTFVPPFQQCVCVWAMWQCTQLACSSSCPAASLLPWLSAPCPLFVLLSRAPSHQPKRRLITPFTKPYQQEPVCSLVLFYLFFICCAGLHLLIFAYLSERCVSSLRDWHDNSAAPEVITQWKKIRIEYMFEWNSFWKMTSI